MLGLSIILACILYPNRANEELGSKYSQIRFKGCVTPHSLKWAPMPQNPEFCGASPSSPSFPWAHKDSCADDVIAG